MLYEKEQFIDLESHEVKGIKSWRFTAGGTDSRVTACSDGLGYYFHSQPHVCFCGVNPCPHTKFTGKATKHEVLPATQQKADREVATTFFESIVEGTAIASKGEVTDSTSRGEPIWISIAKGQPEQAASKFTAAGGAAGGTRTIAEGWRYVDIAWLDKIKTGSNGDVYYELWTQPHGERTVLTKPKVLSVEIKLREVKLRNGPTRYLLTAADYQRLVDAVKG